MIITVIAVALSAVIRSSGALANAELGAKLLAIRSV